MMLAQKHRMLPFLLLLALLVIPACNLQQLFSGDGASPIGDPFPGLLTDGVVVRFINDAGADVVVDAVFTTIGGEVRRTTRRLPAFGPQSTVEVLRTVVEAIDILARQVNESGQAGSIVLLARHLTLGVDYNSGDIVEITIPPLSGDCNSNTIPDVLDLLAGSSIDCDGNDVPDECQSDTDEDGLIDPCDACPEDTEKTAPGICGCGIPDHDADTDGTPDCNDECPDDYLKILRGVCGCGTPDDDADTDGTLDCNDECPNDYLKVTPGLCGCDQPDIDSDEDGVPDCADQCPGADDHADCNTNAIPDTCEIAASITDDCDSNGQPDDCQADLDTDGLIDACDACPADYLKTAPGICGCGIADTDTDSDETPDCHDACPADPLKIEPGLCGCNIPDSDIDQDGVPDCLDQCPGADDHQDCNTNGLPDVCETAGSPTSDCNTNSIPDECESDCNNNGVPDDCDIAFCVESPECADCNFNGIPDGCEPDCDTNGTPDECEIAFCDGQPYCGDCNANGVPDGCDIATGDSLDCNTNGIPDACESRVYWLISDIEADHIGGRRTDGSDQFTLPIPQNSPFALEIAPLARRMFWLSYFGTSSNVTRADLPCGDNLQFLQPPPSVSARALGVDEAHGDLYMNSQVVIADIPYILIMRADLDGSNRQGVTLAPGGRFGNLDVDGNLNLLAWTQLDRATARSRLYSLDLTAATPTPVELYTSADAAGNLRGVVINPVDQNIYFIEQGGAGGGFVYRLPADGSASTPQTLYAVPSGDPDLIALDAPAGRAYWTIPSLGKVQRGSLDGSTPIEDFTTGQGLMTGLAVLTPTLP